MSLDFNFTVTSSFLRNVRIKPYFPFIAGGSCSKLWWIVYSEKATKFCKIFTLLLSYVVPTYFIWYADMYILMIESF